MIAAPPASLRKPKRRPLASARDDGRTKRPIPPIHPVPRAMAQLVSVQLLSEQTLSVFSQTVSLLCVTALSM